MFYHKIKLFKDGVSGSKQKESLSLKSDLYNHQHEEKEEVMPLITKDIRNDAAKCKCIVNTILEKLDDQRRKNNMMYNQLELLAKGLCLVVPFQTSFRKVYGMKPLDYVWREFFS